MELDKYIRSIPDFPKPGIIFKDITTLLKDREAFDATLERFYNHSKNKGITKVVGIESRGFIFGGALAEKLNAGFVPIRKPGKLPAPVFSESYELEYGTDIIEIHQDALSKNDVVLVHDDLLATGGTAEAACRLVSKFEAKVVQVSFLIELVFLNGISRLQDYEVVSLIKYEAE